MNELYQLILKFISYIINELEEFEHNPICEIFNRLKRGLETQ